VRTDIVGFVGIAERGPVDTPVPVESWRQFQAHFGTFIPGGFLAYVVRAFFENDGRRCWVVRVASRDAEGGARAASAVVRHERPIPPDIPDVWCVSASSPGVWGNHLVVSFTATHQAQTSGRLVPAEPDHTVVATTSGFRRGTLVRLSQPPAPPIFRVVSDVDAVERQLIWVSERPELRLPYDAPIEGLSVRAPVLVESIEYTVAVSAAGIPVAVYEGLSLIPEHPSYGPAIVGRACPPLDPAAGRRVPVAPPPIVIDELRPRFNAGSPDRPPGRITVGPDDIPSGAALALKGGTDGLVLLRADDFVGEEEAPEDSNDVKARKRRGIRALTVVDEIAVAAVPDIHIQPALPSRTEPPPPCVPNPCLPSALLAATPAPLPVPELPPRFSEADIYRVQADLVQQCEERGDRVALLDPPIAVARTAALGLGGVRAWRSRFDSNYAAFYYPWLRVVDPLRTSRAITRDIPPSGHVAGEYARTDLRVGVHKAPANQPLTWVQDVTALIDEAAHGALNPLGVNVIRALPGRGLRIEGARTVSSDPSWRYVSVRRLVLMIKRAVALATQWAVFEPHEAVTRNKLRMSLLTYLATLWQGGALAGGSIDEAFFVKCDEDNNTPTNRAAGHLTAEIGVAPVYPFEFIVLRVWRTGNELEITESAISGRNRL